VNERITESWLRAQMVLDVSKAANAHLELGNVLDSLAEALAPTIRFNAIAVEVIEGEVLRLHSLSLKDFPRLDGEPTANFVSRILGVPIEKLGPGPLKGIPLRDCRIHDLADSTVPFVCNDLKTQARFAEERMFLAHGVESYICLPLRKRGKLLGGLYFNLHEKRDFTPYQVQLIADVGEIVGIAVRNALAYEEITRLRDRLQEENLLLQDEIVHQSMYEEIIGSSAALRQLLHGIEKVAPTDSTVLITGETGTGKELLARAIHKLSPRAGRALVKVNCAALPGELIASELFGHEKGAFTGALQQRIGRFETADGGTIFLDEIGELPPDMQVSLLRVLQEKEFERVGGNLTRHTDARVIAATNLDLAEEVAAGRFRRDLYYRLNVFPVHAPPLRSRQDDIPVLVEYFAARFAKRMGKRILRIAKPAMDALQAYTWPGNIRELQNVIERAVILSEGELLRLDPASFKENAAAPAPNRGEDSQRAELENLLRETRGRISGAKGAAVRLGIPASTLESRLRALRINKHAFRTEP
jgi:formate hydrogenlyase transcriptional activator